ncbi:hypothetical protein GZH47_14650 [Paenibacillus rhizovicinus]|uniref:Uncharacterized protein n=1 Tax=Paenibacillus rhizovicinus TaxID=2704463 RepID=A0A6C0P0B9_9BACL|nr:hypothetical protein [Paenibacillus rhizovicinus]QHW31934.1 hypothetical protein GZH47_14650 [Paenibacillus rhizovicinus]
MIMLTNVPNRLRKPTRRHVISCLLVVVLVLLMTGCVPAPKSSIPIADIALTNNHVIVQNETGFIWYNAKLTIDGKYTYVAAMMTSGKSSVPLAKFVDDQGHAYKRDRLSIRHLTIDITDTLGAKRHLSW